ncbi:MAG TPA: hypothetical protein VMU87_18950 [Stellaceae bacterium]|nr:hypothetical protein [Stellaceae bacterium]
MYPLQRHWRLATRIAGAAMLAVLVAGCVYAPPPQAYSYAPGYAYTPGYSYYPYAYPAPAYGGVTLGFGDGGWYRHGWHHEDWDDHDWH